MGNTKVVCTVAGPAAVRGAGRREREVGDNDASVGVEIGVMGSSGVDRRGGGGRGRGDKYVYCFGGWISFWRRGRRRGSCG